MDRLFNHDIAGDLFGGDEFWFDDVFAPLAPWTDNGARQQPSQNTMSTTPADTEPFAHEAPRSAAPFMPTPFSLQDQFSGSPLLPLGLVPQAHQTGLPGVPQELMAQLHHNTAASSSNLTVDQAFSCDSAAVPKSTPPKTTPPKSGSISEGHFEAEAPSAKRDSNARTEAINAFMERRHQRSREPPAQSDFLQLYESGDASVSFRSDAGALRAIGGLNKTIMVKRCPLLAAVFEESRSGFQCHLELLTWETVWPFVRFLYSGSYALRDPNDGDNLDVYENVPTSLLLHCQLYQLGDVYDLKDLKMQAYVNVLRQCEFGCSSPFKPIDLCDAIKFLFASLPSHSNLIDAFVNYCVSCFLRHSLADFAEIKELIYEQQAFYLALYQNALARGREFHETTSAIIRMPFKRTTPDDMSGLSRNQAAAIFSQDVVSAFHSTDVYDDLRKKRKRCVVTSPADAVMEKCETSKNSRPSLLPLRQRMADPAARTKLPTDVDEDDEARQSNYAHKRRASTEENSSTPIAVRVEESEYEFVSGSSSPKSTGSESDDGLVLVARSASNAESDHQVRRDLPLRLRTSDEPAAIPATTAEREGSDEESDWSLV